MALVEDEERDLYLIEYTRDQESFSIVKSFNTKKVIPARKPRLKLQQEEPKQEILLLPLDIEVPDFVELTSNDLPKIIDQQ